MTAHAELMNEAFDVLPDCDATELNRIAKVVKSVIPNARWSERYAIAALVLGGH